MGVVKCVLCLFVPYSYYLPPGTMDSHTPTIFTFLQSVLAVLSLLLSLKHTLIACAEVVSDIPQNDGRKGSYVSNLYSKQIL